MNFGNFFKKFTFYQGYIYFMINYSNYFNQLIQRQVKFMKNITLNI